MSAEQVPEEVGMAGLDLAQVDSLLSALADKEGVRREKAREELVALGAPVVPLLTETLWAHQGRAHFEAAKALSQIGHPVSVPAFVALLGDQDPGVRWVAAEGLVAAGPASLSLLLKRLMESPGDKSVREGGHHVLVGLVAGSKDLEDTLKPVIEACVASDPGDVLPPAAEAALKAIYGPSEGE
jgi:HEAT repeat protein